MSTLKCAETRDILAPDPNEPVRVSDQFDRARDHYRGCPACQRFFSTHRNMAERVRRAGRTIIAPPVLRARVLLALDAGLEDRAVARHTANRPWRRLGLGAMVAAAALAIFAIGLLNSGGGLAHDLLQSVRATGANDALMASSDAGQLEAWLESAVGYPVHIPDIRGAALIGGRVTDVGGVRSAAVTYVLAGESLTYVAMPANRSARDAGHDAVETRSVDGYQLAIWTESGATRAVVATLPRDRVLAIAEECKHEASARPLLSSATRVV